MVAGYFLLLAQKKVTKEKAPSAPRPRLRRGFATGGRVRPRGHPWPLGRIGAIPRAARVRGTRLFRPPFAAALEGTRKGKSKAKVKMDSGFRRNDGVGVSDICGALASAAGTAALCSSRAPLGRGEQAEETAACTARGRAQDARASDVSTGMYCQRTPQPARGVTRAWMPA